MNNSPSIAVLIPCYQEEKTIAAVVRDFRQALPNAAVYVFDNNCTDNTAALAREAGAIVKREKRQGKGFVVASMFDQVDADIYVMVDGDGTYQASAVHTLLKPILDGNADLTVACRLQERAQGSFRPLHIFGNQMVCSIINWMFGSDIHDIFSGYRAFTREAARLIPITARGFDVETELTLQALYRGLVIKEIEAPYGARPDGSDSKLRTYSDGFLVLLKLFLMIRSYKPLTCFGAIGILLFIAGFFVGLNPLIQHFYLHHVASLASVVLAALLFLLAALSVSLGILLNSINLRLLEVEKLVTRPPQNPR